MYKKYSSLLTVFLLINSFDISAAGAPWQPDAQDDHNSTVVGEHTTATGNVSSNDRNGTTFTLNGSWAGQYGVITSFDSDGRGEYTYKLFESTTNDSLPSQGGATDRFQYTYGNDLGFTDTAQIIIDVNPDPNPNPEPEPEPNPQTPIAEDDHNSTVVSEHTTATGNVGSNDRFGTTFTLNGSRVGQYGLVSSFDSEGNYRYELFENITNASLPPEGVDSDTFTYTYANETGLTDTAQLIIDVNSAPTFSFVDDDYENVDVEFNNWSENATPLNSGRNIKGHLYQPGDRDWYTMASAGDEIITLEVCPEGSSCFDKRSWVLYVFDSDLLTAEMEEREFPLHRWVNDTGTTTDLTGQEIINADVGTSNHMYLAYRAGFFEGALIGVVDFCFDNSNTVDIGVGEGARNYLFAISSILKSDNNLGEDSCGGSGSIIHERAGRSALGSDADGNPKSYDTTEEFIVVARNSDDQYAVKITSTGIHPLLSDDAKAKSATFDPNTGHVEIPSVRVNAQTYRATLGLQSREARSTSSTLQFILSDFEALSFEQAVDAYRATYNPENQQVMIPRVTDTESGKAYSVILQFHAANEDNDAWLDLISITEIQ